MISFVFTTKNFRYDSLDICNNSSELADLKIISLFAKAEVLSSFMCLKCS